MNANRSAEPSRWFRVTLEPSFDNGIDTMGCCHHFYEPSEVGDTAFSVDAAAITFGRGCMAELGEHAAKLGMSRVAVFTDTRICGLEPFRRALASLKVAGIDVVVFDEVHIEPTDRSFRHAIEFAKRSDVDGYVSIGGGSVIDTCKAANLYASWPDDYYAYVNAPVGQGRPVPGPIGPHIACPTTSGTGSECTGIAIFDDLNLHAKTGIASAHLRPSRALIDPDWTDTLPKMVLACSAFDVLSHALESYTARPYTRRPNAGGADRPLSQGANPWSDIGCAEALRLLGRYMNRAITDPTDRTAREQVMWAATLAGIAFGNAGVHLPHGMAYAVAGNVRNYRPRDYPPDEPMIPHGMSVILNAPAVFASTAHTSPERHMRAAGWLGADTRGARPRDAGEVVAGVLSTLMRESEIPRSLSDVGYTLSDVETLIGGAIVQKRLLDNAPIDVDRSVLGALFTVAMTA